MYKIHGKNWEARETATYKLLTKGLNAVSDLELLTALVGNEQTAKALFGRFGSLSGVSAASVSELVQVKGMGRKMASRLVAAFEMARRKEQENESRIRFTDSRSVGAYLQPRYAHEQQEIFSVLFLSRNNELIAEERLFAGGVSAVIVDPKVIFKKAINYLCSAIILTHNHPSGNTQPSQADKNITQQIKAASKLLDITVLDHVIVTHRGYYSFADDGQL